MSEGVIYRIAGDNYESSFAIVKDGGVLSNLSHYVSCTMILSVLYTAIEVLSVVSVHVI